MVPSTTKHGCLALGMHRAPISVTQEEFADRMDSLADAIVALPISRENFVKFDFITPNQSVLERVKALGFGHPPPSVWFRVECKTQEDLKEVMSDIDFRMLLDGARDFGLHNGASSFIADVKTRVDRPPSSGSNTSVVLPLVFKVPGRESPEEFNKMLDPYVDAFVALPVLQKNLLRHNHWISNNDMAEDVRAVGLPPAEPVVVIFTETETWGQMLEILEDAEFERLSLKTFAEPEYQGVEAWLFSANVTSKISAV